MKKDYYLTKTKILLCLPNQTTLTWIANDQADSQYGRYGYDHHADNQYGGNGYYQTDSQYDSYGYDDQADNQYGRYGNDHLAENQYGGNRRNHWADD